MSDDRQENTQADQPKKAGLWGYLQKLLVYSRVSKEEYEQLQDPNAPPPKLNIIFADSRQIILAGLIIIGIFFGAGGLWAAVAEITGAILPDNAGEDSFSFLPEILGTGRTGRANAVHHSINGRFAIREGPTKLALCAGSGGWSKDRTEGDMQLYDLSTDIGERTNLAGTRPDDVRRLARLLDRIIANGRSTSGTPQRNDAQVRLGKSSL